MLNRRKVETRKQYEKRKRRRRLALEVQQICGDEQHHPPKPRIRRRQLPRSPNSFASNNVDSVLEIYDRRTYPKMQKRPRPHGRVQRYREFDVALSSASSSSSSTSSAASSKSSHTESLRIRTAAKKESIAPVSRKLSDKKLALQQESYPNGKETGERTDAGQFTLKVLDFSTSSLEQNQSPESKTAAKRKLKEQSLSSNGAKLLMNILCCNFPVKQNKIKPVPALFKGPGMSLTEEKRLWRLALEGDPGDTVTIRASRENKPIDQIEVIPVERTFQTTKGINYSELEGTGIVFSPSIPLKVSQSPSKSTQIPWWQREKWTDSSFLHNAPDGPDASALKTSMSKTKISNMIEALVLVPNVTIAASETVLFTGATGGSDIHKPTHDPCSKRIISIPIDLTNETTKINRSAILDRSQSPTYEPSTSIFSGHRDANGRQKIPEKSTIDVTISDLDESLDDRIERTTHSTKHDYHQYVTISRCREPHEKFEAKIGRQTRIAEKHQGGTTGVSESTTIPRPIFVPNLNHSCKDYSLPLRLNPMSDRVGYAHDETESFDASESDLSLLVRRMEASKIAHGTEVKSIAKSNQQRNRPERPDILPLQSASPLFVALLADANLIDNTSHTETNAQNETCAGRDCVEENINLEQVAAEPDSSMEVHTTFDFVSSPFCCSPVSISRGNFSVKSEKTNDVRSPIIVQEYCGDAERRDANSPIRLDQPATWYHRETVQSPTQAVHDFDSVSKSRDRSPGSNEFIQLSMREYPARKRSVSPIRLYGDPPKPRRMDGSPVNRKRSGVRENPKTDKGMNVADVGVVDPAAYHSPTTKQLLLHAFGSKAPDYFGCKADTSQPRRVVQTSVVDDQSSGYDELRKLKESETFLRKELDEVQAQITERRRRDSVHDADVGKHSNRPNMGACSIVAHSLKQQQIGCSTGRGDPRVINLAYVDEAAVNDAENRNCTFHWEHVSQMAGNRAVNGIIPRNERAIDDLFSREIYSRNLTHRPWVEGNKDEFEIVFVDDGQCLENPIFVGGDEPRIPAPNFDTTTAISTHTSSINAEAPIHFRSEIRQQIKATHTSESAFEKIGNNPKTLNAALTSECIKDQVNIFSIDRNNHGTSKSEWEDPYRDSNGLFFPFFAPRRQQSYLAFSDEATQHARSYDAHISPSQSTTKRISTVNFSGLVSPADNSSAAVVDKDLSWQSVEQLYQLSPQVFTFANIMSGKSVGTPSVDVKSGKQSQSGDLFVSSYPTDQREIHSLRVSSRDKERRSCSEIHEERGHLTIKSKEATYYSHLGRQPLSRSELDHSYEPRKLVNKNRAKRTMSVTRQSSDIFCRSPASYQSVGFSISNNDSTFEFQQDDIPMRNQLYLSDSGSHSSESAPSEENRALFYEPDRNCSLDESDTVPESLYSTVLHYDPNIDGSIPTHDSDLKKSQHLETRRHLLTLKRRHGHLYSREVGNHTGTIDVDKDKAQNVGLSNQMASVLTESNKRINGCDTGGVATVSINDGPPDRKNRLERLKKLQYKMQPFVNERARRRVQQNCTIKKPSASTRRQQDVGNHNLLVEVIMPIIGSPTSELRLKPTKKADHAKREHSVASLIRSKELVHALPAAAKTRNMASAKPGR